MKSNKKFEIKYFPYSPGIPWKINNDVLIPELSFGTLSNFFKKNNNIIIVCLGGLIETFISLYYLELIKYHFPKNKLFFHCQQKYKYLININGLSEYYLSNQIIDNIKYFNTPVIINDNNIYINTLYNYINVNNIYGLHVYKSVNMLSKQVISNSLLSYDVCFLPKIRNLSQENVNHLLKINKFNIKLPYICIFPDTNMSIHKKSCLSWSDIQIKALIGMLKQKNISSIIFTDNPGKFYNLPAMILPINLKYILYFLNKSSAILSEEFDYLLIAGMISKAKIFSTSLSSNFNFKYNMNFLKLKEINIFMKKKLTPTMVYEEL